MDVLGKDVFLRAALRWPKIAGHFTYLSKSPLLFPSKPFK